MKLRPAQLLRAAAALAFVLAAGLIVWLADKAIRFPRIQAEQFGQTAPLWLPLIAFVVFFLGAVVWLFWKAARRLEADDTPTSSMGEKTSGRRQ